MTSELLGLKGNGLVIVAHPDDETIWMGGTILANPQIKWTIFSLCRADDMDRAPKFRRVCRFLGARAIISDLDDKERLNLRESLPEIEIRIKNFLFAPRNRSSIHSSDGLTTTSKFDFVFTHGYNGEYGHPRHRGVSRVVREMVRRGEIRTHKLFNFSYEFDEKKNICRPRRANVFLRLSPALYNKKQKIVGGIYGFRKSTFEYRTLTKFEHFKND